MQIQSNFSLQKLNSFGFLSYAQYFARIENSAELLEAIEFAHSQKIPWQIIGGGSNVVMQEYLPGLTIQMAILGKKLVNESATHFYIDCGAGENWHDFVAWTLEKGYPGLENLALIPGTCGAAPIQNIGAYGSEVSTLIDSVEVLDTHLCQVPVLADDPTSAWQVLQSSQCQFSYRQSLFKKPGNALVVTQVRFAIPKKWQPNLGYAELARYFFNRSGVVTPLMTPLATPLTTPLATSPTPQEIFEAVVSIRSSKLPDPQVIGNAGSFFHNPVVNLTTFNHLKETFPNLISYPASDVLGEKQFKLAAGWLIDQCGLKGYQIGGCGVYEKQALVLVNHGTGTSQDLQALAHHVQQCVFDQFGVTLTQEPINLPPQSQV